MLFDLNKEQTMIRQLFRDFAETEAKPLAAEVDEQERFPDETVEKMAKAGFMGIPYSREYGGQGGDTQMYAMCVEELSRVCATTGVIVSAHTSLCCFPVPFSIWQEWKKVILLLRLTRMKPHLSLNLLTMGWLGMFVKLFLC